MKHSSALSDTAAIKAALQFHDTLLHDHTPRTAFGMAAAYLARKRAHTSFIVAESALREALASRVLSR